MVLRIIKIVISAIYYSIYRVYAFIFYLMYGEYPGKFIILTYHSVKEYNVHKFKKQMSELIKKGKTISIDSMNEIGNGKYYFAVTFDDGYQSVLKYAIPILQEKNIPAMIFVTTGFLGKYPGWITREENINKFELILTEDQIKEQSLSSIQFGSHTITHSHLDKLELESMRHEIIESKRKLEEILNATVLNLSLPFGSYNSEVLSTIQEAGYKRVFLNVPVLRRMYSENMLYGRTDVSPDDWNIEFRLKISGGYEWLPVGIYIKKVFNKFILKNYLMVYY